MPEFLVRWEINVEAGSVEEAAREARRIQLDPDSLASIFEVQDEAGEWFCMDLPLYHGGAVLRSMEPIPVCRVHGAPMDDGLCDACLADEDAEEAVAIQREQGETQD